MRVSHDCEKFARVSHDSREIFVRQSHDSHGSRANFNQFYFSPLSLEMVLLMSHCADRGKFLAICLRTSVKGWRRVRDICDDLATVLR